MFKRIGLVGTLFVAALALSGLGAQAASASACYRVSQFVRNEKAGNFSNGNCTVEVAKLTGEYVLATIKAPTTGNLWCAVLLLSASEAEKNTGYFKNNANDECKEKLLSTETNLSNLTEVIVLPDVSVTLAGATYPLQLEVTLLTVKTKLSNVVKENLKGEGLLLLLLLNQLGSLGTFEALFTKVINKSGTACFSEESSKKDPSGEVLTKGTWHLVYTSLAGSTPGLQLGVLYLVSPVEVVCGAEIVKVKGDTLSSVVTPSGTETEEYTKMSGVLLGNGEGMPNIRVFYNDEGTSTKAKLEANFGAGFKESDEEVEETVMLTALEGKMFVITNR